MQTEKSNEIKLWEKVQQSIWTLQTTPNSPPEIRAAITKVHTAFHDYKTSIVSYLDFLVYANTRERKEHMKFESIMSNHKNYVDTSNARMNDRKNDLFAEVSSRRSASSSRSSVSSAALRARVRGEAATAIKKQKCKINALKLSPSQL